MFAILVAGVSMQKWKSNEKCLKEFKLINFTKKKAARAILVPPYLTPVFECAVVTSIFVKFIIAQNTI